MRLFIRLFLWLLITVLSLQGGAAIAMEAAEQPAHEAMVMSGHMDHQAAAHGDDAHCKSCSKSPASPHAKCPACASSCIGSAAPPALPQAFYVPPLVSLLHLRPETAMTSFIPAPLKRPPRVLSV